ncbi:peptidase [Prauserella marina]|uniref:Alpha/beta hydrolase fold n=1 Tax=Prauserella marina TaxID=530584 RepID=A0A222VTW8_9PSEU|nr:alpha/beta hydrolase [Prauserella marina]ASR37173.1 peptidase [Prauserella marina]PWV72484.1 alpha/beta hydrolase family protein [Prauserella marina]SDD78965.1 alpha/beta hydrolase fold [Prauserella marina]
MRPADNTEITGVVEGVPFVALPPGGVTGPAPLVVTWHLMDAPRSESAMAAALPMTGLPAWRVYLGLPMFGARAPKGGAEEFFALAASDYVLNVAEPVVEQAAAEFPSVVAALRDRLSITDSPVGVAGGSAGAGVALEVTARADVPVAAAALVSPVCSLRGAVGANERSFGVEYEWSERSSAVADKYDYVRRAKELGVPVLLVVGGDDDPGFREPAVELRAALGAEAKLVEVPGMAHALAEEPGVEAAPQTEHAEVADAEFTAWFARYLR